MKLQFVIKDLTCQIYGLSFRSGGVAIKNGASRVYDVPDGPRYFFAWTMIGAPGEGLSFDVVDAVTGKTFNSIKESVIPAGTGQVTYGAELTYK